MKKIILPLFVMLAFFACEKNSVLPTDTTIKVKEQSKGQPSNERKGGNSNGGNNSNTPGYNPCANYEIYPEQITEAKDWHFNVDTTICGFVIIRWDSQPGFIAYNDSCNGLYGRYFLYIRPVVPDSVSISCPGNVTSTSAYYYQLGSGCSMWPGKEYDIFVKWYNRDVINKKSVSYSSLSYRYRAGYRAPWLGNCN